MTENENTTITMVQTILDCWNYSQGDSQMVQGVAREGGLYPLSKKDRDLLKREIGTDRLKTFEQECAKG